ncbi:T9SS type A sorting domain-containing protein [Chitinophagales bacterium]|nr:T9SS type A sorting domain-containing protein [Chitinophagales bacterium]
MKKNLLFTLLSVCLIGLSYAQLPFSESFDNGIPATWQNIDNSGNGAGVWQAISEGGENFVAFDSDGYGNDSKPENADLITPVIDCSSASFVAVSFVSGFRQYANSVGTASYSTNGGTTWTPFYTVNTDGAEVVLEDLTAALAGSNNVRFKFNYVGDWDYFWYIDDFTVYTPATKDMAAVAVTMGAYYDIADAPIFVEGTLINLGTETVSSFDLNYTVDGGTPVTQAFSGVNIPFGGEYNFSHSTGFTPSAAGDYEITAYASNINGGADAVPANDEASTIITVFENAVQRVPLFEIFTSSTCGPCTPGNENFHSIVDPKPEEEFVSIKYQQDFPGTGDPYATFDAVDRRGFYGINSIPRMEIDGGWDGNANSFSQALYADALAKPAFTFLHATYSVDVATQTVDFDIEALPIIDYPAGNYRLQIAIIENLTTQNVKTNGETEFYQVLKKMYLDENGITVTLDNLTTSTFSSEYTFQGNFRLPSNGQAANRIDHATEHSVEEFSDLRVVVWLEEADTKEVLQAFNAVSPLDTDNDGTPDEVEAYSGTNPNDATDFPDLDGDGLSDWKEVSDGTNPLVADGTSIKDVEFEMAVALSPVPANNVLNVAFALESKNDVSLSVIAADGKVVATQVLSDVEEVNTTFDVTELTNGVYFLQVETENASSSKQFVVNHK